MTCLDPDIRMTRGNPKSIQYLQVIRTTYNISMEMMRDAKDPHALKVMAQHDALLHHIAWINRCINHGKHSKFINSDGRPIRTMSGFRELVDRGYSLPVDLIAICGRALKFIPVTPGSLWEGPREFDYYSALFLSELAIVPKGWLPDPSPSPFRRALSDLTAGKLYR